MALDDMFQGGIDAAVENRNQLNPITPRAEPGFSLWGAISAVPKGAAAGAVEAGAFWSEVAGVFGEVQASYNYSGMMPMGVQTESEWVPDNAKAAQERLLSGESWSNPAADKLREGARWLGPNEQTAGYVEQSLFQFSRVISKAVGNVVVAGPLGGAALTGADEGLTASDELRRQGVDWATRSKIGALTGATTAIGVAVPVAGAGIKGTTALVAGGGPGLFIAQNYLARDILQTANYDNLADRYDPFDPVGLTVSTLLPAAFGGWALRGRARAARAADGAAPIDAQAGAADAPAGAADAVREPWQNQPHNSDLADAARVQRSREVVDSWNLGRPEDIRAANDALLSVMRASDQLASGLPVRVTDAIPMEQAYAARAVERMIARSEATHAELLADAGNLAEPGAITAMRAQVRELQTVHDTSTTEQGIKALAKEIQTTQARTSYKQALAQAHEQMSRQAADSEASIARLEQQIEDNATAMQARQALAILDEQINQMRADRAAIDAPATQLTPVSAALREAGLTGRDAPVARASREAVSQNAPQNIPEIIPRPESVSAVGVTSDAAATPLRMPEAMVRETGDQVIASRVAQLEATRPDALVRLDGSGENIPLTEALARLESTAQQEITDSNLLQIAANCAIGAI